MSKRGRERKVLGEGKIFGGFYIGFWVSESGERERT